MIINRLRLNNIRSYKNAAINFPAGTTLFEGDIGSGKSTILMAIEFSLFGLGSEKGSSLLRTGEFEGKVELDFEVEGKEYKIIRNLMKKGNSVRQSQGVLKTERGIFHLAPTEMKERILNILNFNEPLNPKAQSVIYRYAVFTPQEEIKIILQNPELRLQALRKAFGVEDYKIASENAEKSSRLVNIKVKELESAATDLEEFQKKIVDRMDEIEQENKILTLSEKEESNLEIVLKKIREEIMKYSEEKIKLNKIIGSVPLLEKEVKEKSRQIEDLKESMQDCQNKINDLNIKAEELEKIKKPTEKNDKELQEEILAAEKEERGLRKIETEIRAKLDDYRSIEEKNICPTCDREADPKYFRHKIESKTKELNSITIEVERCTKKLEGKKEILRKLQDYKFIQEKFMECLEQLKYHIKELNSNKKKIKELEVEINESSKELELAKEEIMKLEKVSKKLQEIETKNNKFEIQIKHIREQVTKSKTSMRVINKEIEEFKEQVSKKMKQRKSANLLKDYVIWLEDFFIPTLSVIEKHVMMNINQDLNQNFQKWFNMLIEDPSKEARIDEEFTPIIEQDGYEQDLFHLSGGEKTSVAFAYRIALNEVVRKVSAGMKSNLLILDEPTDGLSSEQLSRVREILDELYCPQIIIVSHEKELESFADQIFRVNKTEGESKILT